MLEITSGTGTGGVAQSDGKCRRGDTDKLRRGERNRIGSYNVRGRTELAGSVERDGLRAADGVIRNG